MKITEGRRYNCQVFEIIDYVGWLLTVPWKFFTDHLISCFIPTTVEWSQPCLLLLRCLIRVPIFLTLSLWSLPLAILGLVMILPIRSKRKSYLLSYVVSGASNIEERNIVKTEYCVATANLCLLPDYMSRVNNVFDTYERSKKIAQKIVWDQLQPDVEENRNGCVSNHVTEQKVENRNASNVNHCDEQDARGKQSPHESGDELDAGDYFDHTILTKFPNMDVLLLQETWYKTVSTKVVEKLHAIYPWIVYDVGYNSIESNLHTYNSGLMVASKYEIASVRFDWFRDFYKYDRISSKGLLQVKVILGLKNGRKQVGFIANTHLQVYQDQMQIQGKQLDAVSQWTDEFRQEALNCDNEDVLLDVLGGDFNFDNLSPVDKQTTAHPIFKKYRDVCRVKVGVDHDWTIGTECRQLLLHDAAVSTPQLLKTALLDPQLRQTHIYDADWSKADLSMASTLPRRDEHGNVVTSPVGGKRRIDYLLCRRSDNVSVTGYHPITALATLTDHIPVCLTITPQA